jgi:glutamate-1-semialdehyde 2,1-aminomutase
MSHDGKKFSRYHVSQLQLSRAEKTIPIGSQTFSKSKTQYPLGISPLFASRVKGAKIWDIDGNCYIDLVSALASVTLGYGDRGLQKVIGKQLKLGVNMSLPGVLESEVSERLVELIPSAEMVRFGKNGSDATSAAIRLARAYTGRDHVAVCGYHGWQDWFIGSTSRKKGVPDSVSKLTHSFQFNQIETLRDLMNQFEGKIAAIIMEPMNSQYPNPGFLEEIRNIATKNGSVLIFDETITGFRFSKGGAQELFGIEPDLSTFGKGIANGFPLSAVVGRRELMMEMEQIFFSGTFGGELLSLAAAKYVLDRVASENIPMQLKEIGTRLFNLTDEAIREQSLSRILDLSGHPSWVFFNWKRAGKYTAEQLKTYFMQKLFENGLLMIGTHNVTLAHNEDIQRQIILIYKEIFEELRESVESETLEHKLKVLPQESVFKVR